ncbi:MAG: Mov34/MPN/PAD-1 family protein [Candidatus Micrarchaeales archaeon]
MPEVAISLKPNTVYIRRETLESMHRAVPLGLSREPDSSKEVGGVLVGRTFAGRDGEARYIFHAGIAQATDASNTHVTITGADYNAAATEASRRLPESVFGSSLSDLRVIGSWHSHPGTMYFPSSGDTATVASLFDGYFKQMDAYLCLIVIKVGSQFATNAWLLRKGSQKFLEQETKTLDI